MTDQIDSDATAEAEARAAERGLYNRLDGLGIAHAHHAHPPLHTVDESRALRGDLPGAHVKNMFLKEKKGGLWLVTCLEDRAVRIRALEKAIGAKNVSFAKPEVLWEALGVRPGAVTPFAAMNDPDGAVRVVLDSAILDAPLVNAHPLHNRATTAVAPADLVAFLEATGHAPLVLDFETLVAGEAGR